MQSPPLAELYDLLRAGGFAIGVDDHVRIGRLLARDVAWTPETLRTSIAALVVTDPHEWVAFDACWECWIRNVEPSQPPDVVRPALPAQEPSSARRVIVISGAIAIVLAVAMAARDCADCGRHDLKVDATVASAPRIDARDSGAPGDKPATELSEVSSPAAPTIAPPPPPSQPTIDDAFVVLALGAIVLVIVAIVVARARARRRFLPGPWRYALAVPPATRPILPRIAIADGAADLTSQAPSAGHELDLARSIAATVACGGLPTLVHRRPMAASRYLVLEDTAGGANPWNFIYDELLRGLAHEGVELERYTFAANPGHCVGHDGRVVVLGDLVDHADALIVIGDGDAAVDPLDCDRAEWLALLGHMRRRLWINPIPPARWGAGARTIASDTPMEHGVAFALAALNACVDSRVRSDTPYPAVIERAPGTASAIAALRTTLGERAFRLVAAVSVTGPPTVAAARWLAELHALEVDEHDWLSVATLPWFRTEQWPEGVRDRLSEALGAENPDLARSLAATADRLLAASEPRRGSAAHFAWQLDGADRASQRGERAVAASSLNQIARTPFAYQARRRLAALGLPIRARRLRYGTALAATGVVAVVVSTLITRYLAREQLIRNAGTADLVFTPFDWVNDGPKPASISEVPALAWELYAPVPGDPHAPGAPIRAEEIERLSSSFDGVRRVDRVRAQGGTVFLKITGRGRVDEHCAASWVRIQAFPGYGGAEGPKRLEIDFPTCQATRAGMLLVEAGPFVYGGPGESRSKFYGQEDYTEQQQEVALPAFWMDRTEVSNAAFEPFGWLRQVTGYTPPIYGNDPVHLHDKDWDTPVTNIDAFKAEAFCRYMGKELPGDLEWAKAARGGKFIHGLPNQYPYRQYPWGPDPSPACVNQQGIEDGAEWTAPVGSYGCGAGPYGHLNLVGNVDEWISREKQLDRQTTPLYVVRGGSVVSPPALEHTSISFRNHRDPSWIDYAVGFRCVAY